MSNQRRKHSAEFKAKVALAALKLGKVFLSTLKYNHVQIHSYLGGLSPCEYEVKMAA